MFDKYKKGILNILCLYLFIFIYNKLYGEVKKITIKIIYNKLGIKII